MQRKVKQKIYAQLGRKKRPKCGGRRSYKQQSLKALEQLNVTQGLIFSGEGGRFSG